MSYRHASVGGWLTFVDHPDRPCAGLPVERFYPERGDRGGTVRKAKVLCRSCPVVDACREWAIAHHERGVWGATSDFDRERIRRERRLIA
jgi:WhiB family transcriptional regulator, redox-sensing transcriptional regulator